MKLDMLGLTSAKRASYIHESKKWFADKREYNDSSPDIPNLNRKLFHDIFVYDTCKQSFRHHSVFSDEAQCLGVGWTKSNLMTMYMSEAGYPIAIAHPSYEGSAHLYGEVWRVPTSDLVTLDYFNHNTSLVQRMRAPALLLPRPGNEHERIHPVWLYLGKSDYWHPKLDKMQKLEVLSRNRYPNFKYYIYTKKLDDEIVRKNKSTVENLI